MNTETHINSPAGIRVTYPRVSDMLVLFFCGYVIAWYLQVGIRIPMLGAIRFEFLYAAALTALAILGTPRLELRNPLLPWLILYFLVIAIQVPFSYDFENSWEVFIERFVKFAFMSFFIVSFVRSPVHLKFFLAAFLLACLKMGQEGLVGKITGGLVWENQGVMRLHGSTPLYAHPNSYAGMALGTLPFVYYLWPLCNKYTKAVLVIIAVLSLNIVIFTGSRTGYVGLIALIAYFFLHAKNKKRFAVILLVLAFLALPLIPADYQERFESIFTGKEKEGASKDARIEVMKDAAHIFAENPFGVGVAAFPKKRMDTFDRSQDTHNLYLEIATNLGVQGLIIFAMLVFKTLKTLHNIRSTVASLIEKVKSPANEHAGIIKDLRFIEAAAMAVSAFVVLRLVLGLFGMDLYEIYWWFAIGLSISLYSMLHRIKMTVPQHDQSKTFYKQS